MLLCLSKKLPKLYTHIMNYKVPEQIYRQGINVRVVLLLYGFIWYQTSFVEGKLVFFLSMILFSIFSDSAQVKKYVVAVLPFKIRPFRFYHGVCRS